MPKGILPLGCVLVALAIVLSPLSVPAEDPDGDGVADLRGADQLLFSTFLGSTADDRVYAICSDAAGNVYVTGWTKSDTFPTTTGAYDTSFNGIGDVFVSKLNASGDKLLWSTFVGGTQNELGTAISIDPHGDVVVSGTTRSSDFPTTTGSHDSSHNGATDVFVLRLDANGSILKNSTYLGGSNHDVASHTLDSDGNVYLSGFTYSTDWPTTAGVYDRTANGVIDIVVAKLNANLSSLVFSTYVGGTGAEYVYRPPSLDGSGNILVAGQSNSADFPTVAGCYDTVKSTAYDSVVLKLDPTGGKLIASTFLGGTRSDSGLVARVNPDGNVVVAGTSTSPDYPVVSGGFDTSHNGGNDFAVSMLDKDLTRLLRSTFVGGSMDDTVLGMEMDGNGTVYLVGPSDSIDYPTAADYYDDTHNGYWDVVLTRLSSNLSRIYNSTFVGGSALEEGQAIHLDARNDIYFGGRTLSTGFPVTSGAFDTSHNGGEDGVVAKLRFPEDPNQFLDDDDDGVKNWADAFPRNPFEFRDTDGDGMGDNLDPDADGDGVPDVRDDFPLDPSETRDTDRDGVGDNADTDDDGDGVNDTADAFPLNPYEILDSDGDGIGDNLDPDDDNDNVTDEQERLDAIGRQFANISASVDLLTTLLVSGLDGVNASLRGALAGMGDDVLTELRGMNSTLASRIGNMMDDITSSLDDLGISVAADIDDLGTWLDEVLGALDHELERANTTLHAQVAGLDGRTAAFYDALALDLERLSGDLSAARDDLSDEAQVIVDDIDALLTLVADLDALTLSELRTRLTAIAANLSAFDEGTAARLSALAGNISAFETSTISTLEDLEKLGAIIEDLEQLDADLALAQEEVESSVDDASSEEKGRLSVNMALIVVALVLLAVVALLVTRGRRGGENHHVGMDGE